MDMEELAELKKGTVAHEGDFLHMAEDLFTDYYKSLGSWVNRLREGGVSKRWETGEGGQRPICLDEGSSKRHL
jgi:hypothetical protein